MRSLKFTTKSAPRKIQGKFIQFKKDPFKFKIIFKKTRTRKIFQIQGEEEKNGKFIPIFSTGPRHMGGNFWIFHFWGGPRLIGGIIISGDSLNLIQKILSIFGGGLRLIYFSFFALDHALYTFFFVLKHYIIFTNQFYTLFFP